MKIVKKITVIILWIISIILVLSLISGIFWFVKDKMSENKLEKLKSVEVFTPEQVIDELNNYQKLLEETHPNPYHSISKEQFDSFKNTLITQITTEKNRKELFIYLSQLSHLIQDEHVYVDIPNEIKKEMKQTSNKYFPLIMYNHEGIQVYKDLTGTIPFNSKIISMDGVPIESLISEFTNLKNGRSKEQIEANVFNDFSLLFYIVYGSLDEYVVEYEYVGKVKEVTIQGVDYTTYSNEKELKNHYEFIDNNTVVFHFNAFDEVNKDIKLDQLIDQMFKEMKEKDTKKLIIDLTKNHGGNSAYGDHLLQYLSNKEFKQMTQSIIKVSPESKKGFYTYLPTYLRWTMAQYWIPMFSPLYTQKDGSTFNIEFDFVKPYSKDKRFTNEVELLISSETMSSASLFAGTFKDLNIGKLTGTPTGGYPEHYGNVFDITLPISGMNVQLPTSINYGIGGNQPVTPN